MTTDRPTPPALNRRDFLGAAAAAATLGACDWQVRRSASTQKILVLGGTNFVGPAIVAEATTRGHEVTLFNRGITRPELFTDLEALRGTRRIVGSDLRSLEGRRRWDTVIDVWPEHRALVEETTALLRDRVDYYAYVSSIAVYTDFSTPGIVEDAPVHSGPPWWYGSEKAAAEAAVQRAFEGRYDVARCPAIVGPRDPGAGYHFWLRRLASRDEVLCPGSGHDPVQVLDVRDLATWMLDGVEARRPGTYNLTGPWPPPTLRQFLTATAAGIVSSSQLTWVDGDFLRRDQGLHSFTDLPFWAPLDEDEGFFQIDGRAALRAGATYRRVEETAAAAWRYYQSHFFKDTTFPYQHTGISQEREDAVLRAWHARDA